MIEERRCARDDAWICELLLLLQKLDSMKNEVLASASVNPNTLNFKPLIPSAIMYNATDMIPIRTSIRPLAYVRVVACPVALWKMQLRKSY